MRMNTMKFAFGGIMKNTASIFILFWFTFSAVALDQYASGKKSNCPKLIYSEVEKWKYSYTYIERKIKGNFPPGSSIHLGDSLASTLNSYDNLVISGKGKMPLDKKKAIVVVFDWKSSQSGRVSLIREYEDGSATSQFPEKVHWKGSLKNERRWIHHERADAFLPAHQVTRTLKLREHEWFLTTK
uniref:Uncharacterized protein n=1 Tax=Candidatus Kentrum sp. TUN TaxID=2126343 RepID=A0A450ZYD0_9GAMM|nr:MAG: hypothetical protein BECKTUN1418F_GA0071002_11543 [Candidatus Kentron sp. TUN]VFK67506.1 MAG: hypothetical protein BECKTUN1418E_GA0071001_11513 [Candidatus Kentron sp. TUN]